MKKNDKKKGMSLDFSDFTERERREARDLIFGLGKLVKGSREREGKIKNKNCNKSC